MRMTIRGGPIYIVGRKSRAGGRARMTIAGRSRTIDFYSARARSRRVVAILRPGPGRHRVKVTQVSIDAVAARRGAEKRR